MKDISDKNFGPLIAFCLPGFILLLALSRSFPEVKEWLEISASKDGASIGGFLYATLASLSLGLLLSGIRWATVDQFLEQEYLLGTGPLPTIDFTELNKKDTFAAFSGIVENHYRYYQYYSNSLVAVELGGLAYLWKVGKPSGSQWALAAILLIILFAASRDCFRKFRIRGAAVTTRRTGDDERMGAQAVQQAQVPEGREESQEGQEQDEEDGEEDEKGRKEKEVNADSNRSAQLP
jgi:hypothetical protein